MIEQIERLNQELAGAIGLTLLDVEQSIGLILRFCLNIIVVSVIARYFYFPRSKRRDYLFIFIIMSMSIFMLVSFMGADSLNTGAALGLFAIFGIIRYRTEAIPIREMTYLFMLVSISVINGLSSATYHAKAVYWDGVGILTLIFANIVFLLLAWIFEKSKLLNEHCSKYIRYDNVNLVSPAKRQELIADLEARTGLKIVSIEVGAIDYLKDSVLIRIYYDEDMDRGCSIATFTKFSKMN